MQVEQQQARAIRNGQYKKAVNNLSQTMSLLICEAGNIIKVQ